MPSESICGQYALSGSFGSRDLHRPYRESGKADKESGSVNARVLFMRRRCHEKEDFSLFVAHNGAAADAGCGTGACTG